MKEVKQRARALGRMEHRPTPVTVEYTSRGKRVQRQFPDAYTARRFYTSKLKAGKGPKVLAAK